MNYSFESIDALFSAIAPEYDRMNDIMSLGWHHLWKAHLVDQLCIHNRLDPWVYLDMACGSGDIGGRVLKKAQACDSPIVPIFVDPNKDLLAIAQNRYPDPRIQWYSESAENLSIDSDSVHVYTISFGLRNVDDRRQSLARAYDVLMPGGQFWCLEFSHPTNPWIHEAFQAYLKILPLLGQGVIGQSEPYAYLADSIRAFPSHRVLSSEMMQAGFTHITHEPLSYGVVTMTRGVK